MRREKIQNHNKKVVTLSLFLLWPILASWFSFLFSVNAFFSSVIFFGIPSILLSFYKPHCIKKSLYVSFLMVPFMAIVDYVAETTQVWLWPLPNSLFPFRFFNVVSVEVLVWIFLHVYVVIMYYQYFFERKYIEKFWDKKAREAFFFTCIFFVGFVLTFILAPKILNIPYWYIIFGIVGILPIVIFEDIRYPLVFPKLLKVAIYFFYLNLSYEITALKIGWWSFPSKQFIGQMHLFDVTFPFEEFFFWITIFTLAILSYYEYFFNQEQ